MKSYSRAKARKRGIEAHEVAIVFGDGGGEIVVPDLAAHTAEGLEGMDVTADEGFEGLAVRELQIHFSAVAFDQTKGIQLARRRYRPARRSGPNRYRNARLGRAPCGRKRAGPASLRTAQVILDDGDAAVVSKRSQPLRDHGGVRVRVLLQQFGDDRLKGSSLLARSRRAAWQPAHSDTWRWYAGRCADAAQSCAPSTSRQSGGDESLICSGVSIGWSLYGCVRRQPEGCSFQDGLQPSASARG